MISVGIDVSVSPNLQSKNSTYTTNGNYTINPDEGYDGLSSVGVTVNYDSTDYRNQTGTVDFDGLRAIGWDETSIKYLNANALHYPWENDNYKVTDGNKALYGVVNKYEGSIGESRWIFCKKIDGEHYPFTEEEEEIKKKLADKYLCNDKDKIITMKGLKSAYANGEITLDEYNEGIDELIDNEMGWIAFQEAFEKAIGCEVTFATLLIDNGIKIHAN